MMPPRSTTRLIVSLFAAIMVLLIIASCTSASPTPPAHTPVPPTRFVVVVTLTPTPVPSVTPTPTLPYDINALSGNWQLDITYTLLNGPVFGNIRYRGSAPLQVDAQGKITGNVALYTTAEQPPCAAAVLTGQPLNAQITGALRADGSNVVGDLVIGPEDPAQTTSLRLSCADLKQPILDSESILWPALRATGGLTLSLPFTMGSSATMTRDLTGPTAGALHGMVVTSLELSR